jgi:hypothetical protein
MAGMPVTPGPPGPTGELVTPAAALLRVLTTNGGTTPMAGKSLSYVASSWVGAGTKDFTSTRIFYLLLGDTLILRRHLLARAAGVQD